MPVIELAPVPERLVAKTHVSEVGPRVIFIQPEDQVTFNSFRTEENESVGEYPEWITDWVDMPVETWYAADGKVAPSLHGADFVISGGSTRMPDQNSPMLDEIWDFQAAAEAAGIAGHDICYSHQVRSRRRGGSVGTMDTFRFGVGAVTLTEQGMHDPVLEGLPSTFLVFQSNLMVVTEAGKGATELAKSGYDNEILRSGEDTSSQFHPEGTIKRWKALARSKREGKTLRVQDASGELVVPTMRQYQDLVVNPLDTHGPQAEASGKIIGANIKRIAEARYVSRIRGIR